MKTLILFFMTVLYSVSYGQWAEISNGMYGADVYKIVKYGDYYVISTSTPGGTYKIKNNEDSWVKSNNSLKDKRIRSFAVKGNILFAGTYNDGIYVADSPELNWSKRGAGIDSNNIYCIAVSGENIYAGTNNGLYVSADNGFNWSHISSLDRKYVLNIAFDNGRIIVGAENKIFTESGLLVSADSGKTWEVKNNGLSNMETIKKVVVDGMNIYAISQDYKLYVSGDKGETWKSGGSGTGLINDIVVFNGSVYAATYFNGIAVSFNNCQSWTVIGEGFKVRVLNSILADGDTLIVGSYGMGVYKSVDYGMLWSQFGSQGLNEAQVKSVGKAGDKLYSCVEGGLYSSADNGTNWFPSANGLKFDYATSVAEYGGDLFLGTNSGLFQSADNGATWFENLKYNSYKLYFSCLEVNNNKLYAGLWGGQSFMKTTDRGETWEKIGSDAPIYNKSVGGIFFAGDYIFVTGSGAPGYYSTDDGVTWIGIEKQSFTTCYCFLHYGSEILVGANKYGLYKALYGQLQWEKSFTGSRLDSAYINSLVSTGAAIFAGTSNRGVFISKDSGNTWAEANAGLPTNSIKKLYIAGPYIYAITENSRLYRANLSDFGITSAELNNTSAGISSINAILNGDGLQIEFSAYYTALTSVTVYNCLGQPVAGIESYFANEGKNSIVINAEGLLPGAYFIRIITAGAVSNGKFIK